MFDVAPTELLLVAFVAIIVIGPKDLPKAMRFVGHWVGRARGVARQFRSGFDAMVREAELEEMEKRWKEENERIMREHPSPDPALPAPDTTEGSGDDPAGAGEGRTGGDGAGEEDGAPVMVEKPLVHPSEDDATPADKAAQ
ncbi:sec-independent protein translocase protein TatB [Hephaestia caeni]|uniref:Sec-independent protein translocase protein TatB n=1 Tax=Hephaestia caeni TaxID=645617 RepID=A0A397PBU3_9SPHN|nr:Sec-independent protein translocase protein TatB [Hephaestia caeni]RIA47046.1 sec-independent protein translocase protein TatB [Hephaestia caeni]